MNPSKKGEGVPLLNFEGGPEVLVPLLQNASEGLLLNIHEFALNSDSSKDCILHLIH